MYFKIDFANRMFSRSIYFKFLIFVWLIWILFCLFYNGLPGLISNLYHERIAFLLFLTLGILIYIFLKLSSKNVVFKIFFISFILSFIACLYGLYIPVNDFENYYMGAYWFSYYGFSEPLYAGLAWYKIPSFAGQAIINGYLMNIFSKTLLGFQFINCIFTSGSCCLVYLLTNKCNINVALIASTIYMVYPERLISSPVTTNAHGSTFFLLLGLYVFFLSTKYDSIKKFTCIIISSLALCISHFYHPSVMLVFASMFVFVVIFTFSENKIRTRVSNLLCPFLLIGVLFYIILSGSMNLLYNVGFVQEPQHNLTANLFQKIAVGLNVDTIGRLEKEDYDLLIKNQDDSTLYKSRELVITRYNETSLVDLIRLLQIKTWNTWFGNDDYAYFLMTKKLESTPKDTGEYIWLTNLYNDMIRVDTIYSNIVWLLVIIELIYILFNKLKENELFLYIISSIPMSWMYYIALTEQQARFRYQSMPILIIIASFIIERVIKMLSYDKS